MIVWKSPRCHNKIADDVAASQETFYNTMTANYNADYGQFESIKNDLMSKIQPIIDAGPSQYGYSTAEDANLRSTAIDADAAATQNAQVAANQQITASNGGADVTPTGAKDQLRQEADVAGAQKLSSDEQAITTAGYDKGTQNYDTALGVEQNTMGMMNPTTWASATSVSGNALNGAVSNAITADDAWQSMVGGALGGASGALTSWALPKK